MNDRYDRPGGRWQDRGYGRSFEGRGDYGPRGRYEEGRDDRGFFDRAGDEVRSWFGDEEAERRREADARNWEREQGEYYGASGTGYSGAGYRGTGGGWGNQSADSWNRERPGERAWTSDRSFLGGSDYDRDYEPRGARYGALGQGGYRDRSPVRPTTYGGDRGAYGTRGHDPHYAEWRGRQIESLDRDYDEYRRENQSRFEQEFGTWRNRRTEQRQSLGRVTEHMEVTGSDGEHIGTVDKVRGDRIILTRNDENAGGRHHSIPCSWIDRVEDKVIISKTRSEAMQAWQDEETNRALFEREDQGSQGPHVLNRSFSGTY